MESELKNIVLGTHLISTDPSIHVGSVEWTQWLTENNKFKYKNDEGHFIAQAEKRRNGKYWYAYRKRDGRLEKIYLGKSEQLTSDKLRQCCRDLSRPNLLSQFMQSTQEPESNADEIRIDNPSFPLSKVDVPMLPRFLVSRPKLIQTIHTPITLIYAPSGFGKSTLLNEWRQKCGFPVAWLTVDKDDNYRTRFFYSIVKSIQNIYPTFGVELLNYFNSSYNSQVSDIIPKLTSELTQFARQTPKFGLVLDDFHHIQNPDIFDSLQAWFKNFPSNMVMVISGHNRPPLLLGDLRARSYVTELDANDLRFTREEGVHYLQQYAQKGLNNKEYEKLTTHAEGWAAGLTLTGLALSKQDDPHQFVEHFSGAHIYMREYFMETVLERTSPEIQNFLLKTSVLKHINGSLANTIVGIENGEEILTKLWEQNLFIVKLEQPGWYRYHDLFSEMLQSQLKLRYPGEVDTLHLAAAHWYYNQIATADAIYHLLATKAWDEAALLIEEMAFRELEQFGEDSRLLRWLQELPVHVVQNHKNLLYVYLRLAYHALPPQKIERFVTHVENSLLRKPNSLLTADEKDMLTEITSLRNHWFNNEQFTIPFHDDENARWKLLVDMHVVRALSFDDPVTLEEKINDVYERSLEHKNLFVTLMAGGALARRSFLVGNLRKSEKISRQTLEVALTQRGMLPEPSSICLSMLTRVEIARNDLMMADKYLKQIAEVDPNPTSSNMTIAVSLLQAMIELSRKDYAAARATLQEVRKLHEKQPSGQWMDQELIAYEAMTFMREGDMESAHRLLAEADTLGEHMLTKLMQCEFLLRRRQPELAEYYLNELDQKFPGMIQFETKIDLQLMRAIAYYEMDQSVKAKTTLIDLVKSAAQENHVQPFLDRLDICQPLLQSALKSESLPQYSRYFIKEILSKAEQLLETELEYNGENASVSAREREVLNLMSFGDSNRDMALKLSVSESTIKTHITNIFSKLKVNNRVQAIMQARKMGLL